jgi:hypothetical protein
LAAAFRVRFVFGAKYLLHELGQLMPDGELTTLPCPATPTVTIG